MKKILFLSIIFSLITLNHYVLAKDWHSQIGLSYISGIHQIEKVLENNLLMETYEDEGGSDGDFPISLYYEAYYDCKSIINVDRTLFLGFGIGPFAFGTGTIDFFDIPINIDTKYYLPFLRYNKLESYIKLGAKYHFINGDDIEKSTPGFYAGLGTNWEIKNFSFGDDANLFDKKLNNLNFSIGFDISYDFSKIEITKKLAWPHTG